MANTQSHVTSFQAAGLRVVRLSSLGAPVTGTTAAYTLTGAGFMRVSLATEYEAGEDFSDKSASGEICSSYRTNDILKFVNVELEICEPDPQFTELVNGGTLLTTATVDVGYSMPLTGVDSNPNGTGLEIWSVAIANGSKVGHYRWVLPKTNLRLTGDRVIENGRLATVFSGAAFGNTAFSGGPADDISWATGAPYLYYRDDNGQPTSTGYYTVT